MHRLFTTFTLLVVMVLLAACGSTNPTNLLSLADLPAQGNAAHGKELFENGSGDALACISCHTMTNEVKVGPGLGGLKDRAASRVPGQSAQEYVFYSITQPSRYMVSGFSNLMYPKYGEKLSKQDLSDLIAYLLESSSGQ